MSLVERETGSSFLFERLGFYPKSYFIVDDQASWISSGNLIQMNDAPTKNKCILLFTTWVSGDRNHFIYRLELTELE